MSIKLNLLDVVAADGDYDAVADFYRRLGIEVEDGPAGDVRHAHVRFGAVELHLDNDHLAGLYNAGFRTRPARLVIGFRVDRRDEVDALHAHMVAGGHESRQVPFDAFWGARYAIVADPDGNDVGIMSPSDDTMRSWPPTPSPSS
jgi:uncharacterized glyoxalase superfamily protein PhnB